MGEMPVKNKKEDAKKAKRAFSPQGGLAPVEEIGKEGWTGSLSDSSTVQERFG